MTQYSRRGFLTTLGATAAAGPGLMTAASAQETPVVEMGNDYFDPIGLHVEPGTTVRFGLAAGTHTATAYPDRIPDGATAFDSGTLSSGSFEHTFETPGTYDYYCIPHKSVGMVGRIVVGSPGGPAEASSIPDGEVPSSDVIVDRGSVAIGADVEGSGSTGGGMMGPGGHRGMDWGAWGWVWMPAAGLLSLLALSAGAVYLAQHSKTSGAEGEATALATLEDRYARGEISEAEFQRRREQLSDE